MRLWLGGGFPGLWRFRVEGSEWGNGSSPTESVIKSTSAWAFWSFKESRTPVEVGVARVSFVSDSCGNVQGEALFHGPCSDSCSNTIPYYNILYY